MPVYNGIEFLNDSVTSVLLQTFNEWELIIGINGHLKDSEAFYLAKDYELIDKRIRVFDFYNLKGKSNTLNEMVKYCKYNFIALLDVDDIWQYNKLKIQKYFLNDYDVIGSNCQYFGDLEGIVPKIPLNDISRIDFSKVNPIINSSSIIRKDLCYWNENGIEDYDLWLRLRSQNKKFYNCPEILVKHRIHKQSAFNSKGHNDKIDGLFRSHGIN
jgi:glycosyltransferase involved in cell wall biosynthesis